MLEVERIDEDGAGSRQGGLPCFLVGHFLRCESKKYKTEAHNPVSESWGMDFPLSLLL